MTALILFAVACVAIVLQHIHGTMNEVAFNRFMEETAVKTRNLIDTNRALVAEVAALKAELEDLRQQAQWPDSATVLIGRDLA